MTHNDLAERNDVELVGPALVRARRAYYEDPAGALAEAVRCHELARSLGDAALCARARALQGAVSIHRGDLRSALELVVDAERYSERGDDTIARCEVAALKGQVSFFTGSYSEALSEAELAVQLADRSGDIELRIFARRSACLVFGNVGVGDWRDRLETFLELTIESGNRWEESISRNDLACYHQQAGDLDDAEREIERALDAAHRVTTSNTVALGVIYSTRADIRLMDGRPEEALADAERSIASLSANGEPNPYMLGVTIRAQLEVLQDQLREQADRDWLTGLHNRRYLARELERPTQELSTGPLSLAVLDLDHFKSINDSFGHDAGDRVLVRVAGLLCDALRGSDIVVRSGGEEFLVLMPQTDARAAMTCCERIREAIHAERWERVAEGLAVSTSVGLASRHDPSDLEALVKLADQRLYEAKRAGRNCVVAGAPERTAP